MEKGNCSKGKGVMGEFSSEGIEVFEWDVEGDDVQEVKTEMIIVGKIWASKVINSRAAIDTMLRLWNPTTRTREVLWEMREANRKVGSEEGERADVKWAKPSRGFMKINVDAGTREGIGTSWGAVCRAEDGRLLWGTTIQSREVLHLTMAEAVAVLHGLQEAEERGLRCVEVEGDCELVIEDLRKKKTGRSDLFLVYDDIYALCSKFECVVFSFVRRNLNRVAHEFAHVDPWLVGRRRWEDDFPSSIMAFVKADLSNI